MITLKGLLINFVPATIYQKKGESLATPVKAKAQIVIEQKRANGMLNKELYSISIPDSKVSLYSDKVGKEVTIEVGILAKDYKFYGV